LSGWSESAGVSVLAFVQTLFVGAVFGLALAAPPGPMNAVIAEESVLRGWFAGFTAGLGAMSADAIFFVLSLVGVVAVLGDAPTLRAAMVASGGVVMLYFAAGAVSEARETFTADADAGPSNDVHGDGVSAESTSDGADGVGPADGAAIGGAGDGSAGDDTDARGFRKAFVLALTNPYQILFWLTVGVGLLEPGTVDVLSYLPGVGASLAGVLVVRTGSPALLVGLFCGILVWIVGFPATLVRIGRRVDAFAPVVAALSAVVLAGFGVTFLWDAVRTLP